jgi:2'-5' RNA ligase
MLDLRPANRLFVGLDLPEAPRRALAAVGARLADELGGRAVPADNLHVTLAFIGRAPDDAGPRLADALGAACATLRPPLLLRLGPVVARPGRRAARLMAAEVHDEDGGVADLAARLTAGLARALERSPPERPLWPHVTLVRFRRPVRAAADISSNHERPFDVSRATLYDSHQIPGRPQRYEPLLTVALGDPMP